MHHEIATRDPPISRKVLLWDWEIKWRGSNSQWNNWISRFFRWWLLLVIVGGRNRGIKNSCLQKTTKYWMPSHWVYYTVPWWKFKTGCQLALEKMDDFLNKMHRARFQQTTTELSHNCHPTSLPQCNRERKRWSTRNAPWNAVIHASKEETTYPSKSNP